MSNSTTATIKPTASYFARSAMRSFGNSVMVQPLWRLCCQMARAGLRWGLIWVSFGSCGVFAEPATMGQAAKFDQLIRQVELGEREFSSKAELAAFIKQLQSLLPEGDRARLLRLNREQCSADYLAKPEQGIVYANQFIQQADLAQNYLELSYFYLCRSQHYAALNQQKQQEQDLRQALALAEQSEDKLAQAVVLGYNADLYSSRGQYADSLVQLFKSHDLYKQLQHRTGVGYAVESIATSFRRMGEFQKALEYLELSEKEFAAPGDQYRLGFLLQQKAFVYADMGKPDVAKQLFHRVEKIYQQLDEPTFVTATQIDLMWVSNMEQRYSESLELAQLIEPKLASYQQKGEAVFNQPLFLLYRAEALSGTGQNDAALAGFAQAHQAITPLNNPRYLFWLLRSHAVALAQAGNYQQAYQQLVQANQIQQELQSVSKQQREALLRYQFDTALNEEKNHQLTAENILSAQQVAMLESAQRWQYIALALFVVLALIALFYAISQIQRNRQLHRLAMTDELTRVGNRRSILWFAGQVRQRMLTQQAHWCLLLIDIDYFKQCNDQYGHDVGDQALVAVAACLTSSLRTIDRVGRTGGEEFLLVLPQTDLDAASQIAERIRSQIEQLRFADQPLLRITVSIGVGQAGRHEEVREVMSRADTALYQAKAAGRNRVLTA